MFCGIPVYLIALAALGLVLATRTIVALLAEGSLRPVEALLLWIASLAVTALGIRFQPVGTFLLLALVLFGLLRGPISSLLSARAERLSLLEEVRRYRREVEERPDFGYAHYRLALALYKLGRLDEAISEMELAVKHDPLDHKAKRLLKAWLREKRIEVTGIKVCPKCFFENPPGSKFCMRCGERLSFEGHLKEFLAEPRSVALLAVGFLAVLGLYGAFSLWGRSPLGSTGVLLVSGGLSAAVLLWARNRERQKAERWTGKP
mgnify:CR=1 FL=1